MQVVPDVNAPNRILGGQSAASVMPAPDNSWGDLSQAMQASTQIGVPTHLSMNDPTSTGRRIMMIQNAFPMFGNDQGAMMSLASLPVPDAQLLDAVSNSLGQYNWKVQAGQLSTMSADLQLGYWKGFPISAQRALQNAGYTPPNVAANGGQSILGRLAGDLGGAVSHVEGAVMDVGGPLLNVLNGVSHLPSHLYRSWADIEESNPGFMGFARTLNPVDLHDAWNETSHPYFHKDDVQHANDVLDNIAYQPIDGGPPQANLWTDQEGLLDLAKKLTATTSDTVMGQSEMNDAKILADRGITPGSPNWQAANQELQAWRDNPQMKRALTILDGARVSMGRDVVKYVLRMDPQSTGTRLASGLIDGGIMMVADPILLAGKAAEAYKVARYSLEDMSRLRELVDGAPKIQRALQMVVDASQKVAEEPNAWRRLSNAMPEITPSIRYFQDVTKNGEIPFSSVSDVVSALEQPEGIKMLAEGAAEAPWKGRPLLPTAGLTTPWKIQAKEFLTNGINYMADGAIYARAARDGLPATDLLEKAGAQVPDSVKQFINEGGEGRLSNWAQTKNGDIAHPLLDRVRQAGNFHIPDFVPLPLVSGRDINVNPIQWGASLLQGATTHVPLEGVIELGDSPRSMDQLRNFVSLFGISGLPTPVRDALTDELINGTDPATRMMLVRNTIGMGLWAGGSMTEESGQDLLNQFLGKLQQSYTSGTDISGLGSVATLADSERGYQLAIPSFADLAGQTKRLNVMRSLLGWTNAEQANAFMSKIWKPSVLLRIGFIPRAAGEELMLWAARSPLAWPRALTAMSAGGDTTEAIARDSSRFLANTGATVPEIGGEATRDVTAGHWDHAWRTLAGAENYFGALGPTQQVTNRFFPSWDEFLDAIKPENIRTLLAEKGEGISPEAEQRLLDASQFFNTLEPNKLLRRYWLRQMEVGGTASSDLQVSHMALSPFTSLTGAIARPWKDEVARVAGTLTRQATERGETVNPELIANRAAEIIGAERKRVIGATPFVTVANNVLDTVGNLIGHGDLVHELDAVTRSAVYHTTEAWRGALRRVMDPAYVDAMREAMSDPRMQRYFAKYVSAGGNLTYKIGDGKEVAIQIKNPDGSIEIKPMTAKRSNFVVKTMEQDPGSYGHDFSVKTAMWGADRMGSEAFRASLPFVNPGTLDDLHNVFGLDATPAAYDAQLQELLRYTQRLNGEQTDAVAKALTNNTFEDYQRANLVISKAGKSPPTATSSLWENAFTKADEGYISEIKNLSPDTRGQLAGFVKEAQGKGPAGVRAPIHNWTAAERDGAIADAVETKAYDPEMADAIAANVRSHVGSDGTKVADQLGKNKGSLFGVMVDQPTHDALLANRDLFFPEDGNPYHVLGNEILRRFRGGELTEVGMDRLDRQGGGYTPLTSWLNSDPRVAREMSKELYTLAGRSEGEAAIGRSDFDLKYLTKKVGSSDGIAYPPSGRQMVMTNSVDPVVYDHVATGAHPGTSYRMVNQDEMYYMDPIGPESSRVAMVNGKAVPMTAALEAQGVPEAAGITREHAIHDWAQAYAEAFSRQFTHRDSEEILHGLTVPHYFDGIEPSYGMMGEQRKWGSIKHVYQYAGADMPDVAGPQWEDARFSPWARTVRFGMDKVVGPGIDAMVRRPMFMHNLAMSIDENRGLMVHMLDPALFGTKHIEYRPGRYVEDARPEIRAWAGDDVDRQAYLDKTPGPMAAFYTAHPSPSVERAMQRAFPGRPVMLPDLAFLTQHPIQDIADHPDFTGAVVNGIEQLKASGQLTADEAQHLDLLRESIGRGTFNPEHLGYARLDTLEQGQQGTIGAAERMQNIRDTQARLETLRTAANRTHALTDEGWHAFTANAPEDFDTMVQSYHAARYPVLDSTTLNRMPQVIEQLELLAERTTGETSLEARMIADSLRTATTDGTGTRLAAHEFPPVEFRSAWIKHQVNDGALHGVIARAQQQMPGYSEDAVNAALQNPAVVRATRRAQGPTITERMGSLFGTQASMRDKTMAILQAARQSARSTGELDAIDNALRAARSYVVNVRALEDPETMVREWNRLPAWMTSVNTPVEKLLKSEAVPPWVQAVIKNNPNAGEDLSTIRAGAANLAHVDELSMQSSLEKAGRRTIPFIKNHDVRSQMASWGQNLMPFEFAQEQFAKQWARNLVHSPTAIAMAQLGYDGMRSSGFTQTDANGNVVFTYPLTPMLAEVLRTPLGKIPLVRRMFGADSVIPIVNTFTGQIKNVTPGFDRMDLPAFGPIASVPMNMLSGIFPELASPSQQLLGNNAGVGRSFLSSMLPVSLRRLYNATLGFSDHNPEAATAMNQAAALLYSQDPHGDKGIVPRETDGPDKQQEFLDRLRESARMLMLSKALVGFVGPASPHTEQLAGNPYSIVENLHPDLRNAMSEIHGDYARMIGEMGVKAATAELIKKMGPGASAFTVFTTQGTSAAPGATTTAAADWMDANKSFLSQFKQAGPWLIPQDIGTDQFDRRAYNEQLALELRTRKAPADFLNDIYYAASAETYFQLTDQYHRALDALDPNNPQSLAQREQLSSMYAANRNGYLLQHPVFAQQLQDPANAQRRTDTITQMQTALSSLTLGSDGNYRTPEGGVVPHATQLGYLMQLYNQYEAVLAQLYGVRRSGVTALRSELQQQFRNLGESYVLQNPEMNVFWHGVIAPAAGLFLPDPTAAGADTTTPAPVQTITALQGY